MSHVVGLDKRYGTYLAWIQEQQEFLDSKAICTIQISPEERNLCLQSTKSQASAVV